MKVTCYQEKQSGAVLFVCMVVLLIMTLLGISGMKTTILEEKMAGNFRDGNQAFQSAETALRSSEDWLNTQVAEPVANSTGSNGVWTLNVIDPDTTNNEEWWGEGLREAVWWLANGTAYGASLDGINTAPSTIVEYKEFVSDTLLAGTGNTSTGVTFYQITARGVGGTDLSTVLLQSIAARRY